MGNDRDADEGVHARRKKAMKFLRFRVGESGQTLGVVGHGKYLQIMKMAIRPLARVTARID
jgi:hypothetical protein